MGERANRKSPQIRFKGFAEEWEEDQLGERVEFFSGLTYSPRDVQKGIGTLVLRSSNVKGGEIVDADNVYVDSKIVNSKNVEVGDIAVVVRNGSRSLIGKHAQIKQRMEHTVIGAFMTGIHSENPAFTNALLDTYQFNKEISKNLGATINQITTGAFKQMMFRFPRNAEQTQIGEYFRELDNLIGLHQRKHDKLATLRKAMLQKMFPQRGATVPEIRFKGFSGDWVEMTLGDATKSLANNTLSRAKLNYRSGLARNVHYGDILVRFGEVLDAQGDDVPFVSDDATANRLTPSKLDNGDIVFADAAEDEVVGKCTEVQNVGNQVVLAGLHTIPLRPLLRFAPFYLGYFLNSNAYHDQLLPIMQGTKVLSVSRTAIKQTTICFPTTETEQQKIGAYFRTLDQLISQHATQLRKLQQIKSACLGKMFV